MKRFLGKEVRIEFLDHNMNLSKDGTICKAWGTITEIKPKTLVLEHWQVEDSKHIAKENREHVTLVRSAIVSITLKIDGEIWINAKGR